MKKYVPFIIIFIWSFFIISCANTEIFKPAALQNKEITRQQRLVNDAAATVKKLKAKYSSLDYLLKSARGIMIFPQILKASFLLGGRGGNGVLLAKNSENIWSQPAFYGIGSGSIGFQMGVQKVSVVFVFMNDRVLYPAMGEGLNLGVDATLAAGPHSLKTATSARTLFSDIYYFSDIEGFFAGVSLEGTIISVDDKSNHAYYGEKADPKSILIERKFDNPGAVKLINELEIYNP